MLIFYRGPALPRQARETAYVPRVGIAHSHDFFGRIHQMTALAFCHRFRRPGDFDDLAFATRAFATEFLHYFRRAVPAVN